MANAPFGYGLRGARLIVEERTRAGGVSTSVRGGASGGVPTSVRRGASSGVHDVCDDTPPVNAVPVKVRAHEYRTPLHPATQSQPVDPFSNSSRLMLTSLFIHGTRPATVLS